MVRRCYYLKKQKYLGDILSTSGKLDGNIEAIYNKGLGKVNEIMGILQEVSFGPHYFQMESQIHLMECKKISHIKIYF